MQPQPETAPPHPTSHKENAAQDGTGPTSTIQHANFQRTCCAKAPRNKRKVREQSENITRRNSSGQEGEVVEAVTLYEVVSMGKRAIHSVVDDWIEAYKKDRDVALLDLINFFIQCSGCQGMVTAEIFQSMRNKDVMNRMTEEFDEETGLQFKKFMAYPWILTVTWPVDMDNENYPLIKPGPYWKKFKTNLCDFIAMLVQECQYSVIYDGYLMDTIISLLTGLADSQVRAFRHTSTFAALKLLTALVSTTLNLHTSMDNNQRLYEVEKNRLAAKKNSHKLDHLKKKQEELQQKHQEIETMMSAIFKGTFLQRYRDVVPEIRALCIEEISIWMKMHPNTFLNDSYLKYIGWMLHDKQPDVRLKSLVGLQRLYNKKELVSTMDLFTSRFKDRIVSMTLDHDHEVSVQAMKLLMHMAQNCDDVFMSEDCEILYQFVYASHRPLASAAGEFLYKRLLNHQESADKVGCSSKGRAGLHASYLKIFVNFFLESELHEHVVYLVDSLWDWAAAFLKDWECMTSLLLEGAEDEEEVLSDAQESALVDVILASVRQAVQGHPPVGRGAARKVLSAKEKKVHLEDVTKITEHFVVALPLLLAKFSADAEKVKTLLQIPQYFDLDIYSSGGLEKHLDALLKQVNEIMEKHTDVEVLEGCSRLYNALGQEELEIYSIISLAKNTLLTAVVDTLNQMVDDLVLEEFQSMDDDDICRLSCTLRRIAAFCGSHNLNRWKVYNRTSRLLAFEIEHNSLSHQIILPALQCTYYSLIWELASVMEGPISEADLVTLRSQVMCFVYVCRRYLTRKNQAVGEQAFMLLCDLLIIVSPQCSGEGKVHETLTYATDTILQSELLAFVQEHVFVQQEEESKGATDLEEDHKLNDVHKRRSLLAIYCKLIVFNVVEMMAASEIYKQYMKSYNDFGDIIKETLSRTRHNNRIQSAKTLILCLQQLFQEHIEASGSDSSASSSNSSFSNIKELARRFSLTFGLDQVKSRESFAVMHKYILPFCECYCFQIPSDGFFNRHWQINLNGWITITLFLGRSPGTDMPFGSTSYKKQPDIVYGDLERS
ncbi:cohesin subunit SA-2-like isoform X2 [Ambystoma mexicanum]|uniref:cohesin subunit SA-2-like isoform X2 n=1 Tax=Ambystoma mexicanum TaxID=8296 RepID=UPI0037E970AB